MKDFFSRNFISILVGLLIVLGLFRSRLPDLMGSSSGNPLQKGEFRVHNRSAIHALYYQGDFTDIDLQAISTYMDNVNLFKNNQPAVLGLMKKNDSLQVMRMTTAEYQKDVPEEYVYLYSLVALSIKNNLYPDLKLSLQFTDDQWNPHHSLDESQMGEKVAQYQGKVQPGNTPSLAQNDGERQQILEKWTVGATKLSQAQYYFPVQQNDSWRIYYSEVVSEYVSSLAQVLTEAGIFQEGASNFIAFYTQVDPAYFNGEASYVVAFPFTENQLNDGTASNILEVVHDFLKRGYFKESHLLTLGTDYDFEPVLVRY